MFVNLLTLQNSYSWTDVRTFGTDIQQWATMNGRIYLELCDQVLEPNTLCKWQSS